MGRRRRREKDCAYYDSVIIQIREHDKNLSYPRSCEINPYRRFISNQEIIYQASLFINPVNKVSALYLFTTIIKGVQCFLHPACRTSRIADEEYGQYKANCSMFSVQNYVINRWTAPEINLPPSRIIRLRYLWKRKLAKRPSDHTPNRIPNRNPPTITNSQSTQTTHF